MVRTSVASTTEISALVAARSKARKRAADLLFEADMRGLDVAELLRERIEQPVGDKPIPPYTCEVVAAVAAHQERIDELLATYSHGWTLDRMPPVDRALLRIGVWEILFNDDVPDVVAIDEAVNLAASLSTDESPAFVNGLLGRIVELKPVLLA
jgi:N utilization substance protein B